jgi:ketosteroid isomerase-like protein
VSELARRLTRAIEQGDREGIRNVFAPGATVWHNFDPQEWDLERVVRTLSWLHRNVDELRYDDVRVEETPSGFVQRHVLRGRRGEHELAIAACLVAEVREGRIARLEEYLDPAQARALAS